MKNIGKYTDKEWEELASLLSEDNGDHNDLLSQFMSEDNLNTSTQWKEVKGMSSNKHTDVDKAWDNVVSRLDANGLIPKNNSSAIRPLISTVMKIAAIVLVIIGVGSTAIYLSREGSLNKKIVVATGNDEKNLEVDLPDGSKIFLNRNTKLSYKSDFGKSSREVSLTGEAFFDIAADVSKPFSIDAGKANVEVVGTTFNVITNNELEEVEVYVKTGKVLLSSPGGTESILLDPEFIGTMDHKAIKKEINSDPNYLSWNTGYLDYDGQKLEVVFRDLKRVYNMDIIADNPDILEYPWTSPIDNQPQDTIIRLICASFNLSFAKDGAVYHLSEK